MRKLYMLNGDRKDARQLATSRGVVQRCQTCIIFDLYEKGAFFRFLDLRHSSTIDLLKLKASLVQVLTEL